MKKETWAALALGTLLLALFTTLLCKGKLEATHYTGLVGALMVFCLAVATLPRLLTLKVGKSELTLAEVKDAQRDISAKREEVQRIAVTLARLVAFGAYFEGRFLGGESWKARELGTRKLLEQLMDACSLEREEVADILKYQNALKNDEDWTTVLKMMRIDLDLPDSEFEGVESD